MEFLYKNYGVQKSQEKARARDRGADAAHQEEAGINHANFWLTQGQAEILKNFNIHPDEIAKRKDIGRPNFWPLDITWPLGVQV